MCLATLIDTSDSDRLDILVVTPLLTFADLKLDAFHKNCPKCKYVDASGLLLQFFHVESDHHHHSFLGG